MLTYNTTSQRALECKMKTLINLPIAVIIPLLLIGCLAVDGPAINNFTQQGLTAGDSRLFASATVSTGEHDAVVSPFGNSPAQPR
jgi:hypothetical protein